MSMEKKERDRLDASFGHAKADLEERERRSQSQRLERLAQETDEHPDDRTSMRVVTRRRGIQASNWTTSS